MKYSKNFIVSLLVVIISSTTAFCQLEKLEAAYIYNFATMTSFPAAMQTGNFVIAILGNSSVYDELQVIAQSKKVGSQTIVVRKVNNNADLGDVNMIFVPEGMKSKFSDVVNKTSATPTIVITEIDGYAKKGAVFNFVLVDAKLRFEVNEAVANEKGVKLAANLVKLGTKVQ